jgi:hypothetical protein
VGFAQVSKKTNVKAQFLPIPLELTTSIGQTISTSLVILLRGLIRTSERSVNRWNMPELVVQWLKAHPASGKLRGYPVVIWKSNQA